MARRKQSRISVLLVDDHPVVLEGIRSSLKSHQQIDVVGQAMDGDEAVRRAKELRPEVVLMDISMPNMGGVEAIGYLRKELPDTKVLVLTMHESKEYVSSILRTGARGYVLKDVGTAELVRAIETVSGGGVYFSPNVNKVILNDFASIGGNGSRPSSGGDLSQREREVLSLIAEGYTNKAIAQRLFVSVRTIETHRERIMHKLNIHSAAGLTRWAIANDIVRLQ